MANIGEKICARRKEIGMTQEELAQKMGYKSRSTINKIENGTNDIPQSKIVKFAEVLGTTIADLMEWEKEEKNNDTIAGIIVRMRNDELFLSVVEDVGKLDSEKLTVLKQMLSTFLK